MKVLLCASIFIAGYMMLVSAEGCVYDDQGLCMSACPEGTSSYAPSCTQVAMSQRTCRSPRAKPLGELCDYSRCDCPRSQVWDEAAKTCVFLKNCSDQSSVRDNDGRI